MVVRDKIKNFNWTFRESSVEAVKIQKITSKEFSIIDSALFWTPISWYMNCQ